MNNLAGLSLKQRDHLGIKYVPYGAETDPKIKKDTQEPDVKKKEQQEKPGWVSYVLPKLS